MNEDYLPLAYLNAFEYCQRRFYWEYILGETADNEHIVIGRHLHRNINIEGVIWEGDKKIHRQQWVWSERIKVKGIIDAVEDTNGKLVPVEYKKGKMNKHLNDHFQLCAAAICLEERTGKIINYGEIFYHGNRRRQKVEFTTQLRQLTTGAIAQAYKLSQAEIPQPITNSKKCRDCSLQAICLPQEIKYLRNSNPL